MSEEINLDAFKDTIIYLRKELEKTRNENIELLTKYDQLDSSYEKLTKASWDVVGESGLNDSVERMEKVLLELDDDLKLSAKESDRIFNEIQKRLHENCDGAPDGGHTKECKGGT
jgi:hypothetical protein